MIEIQRIQLDQIEADPNNIRKNFEGIDALARSFAFTPGRPGEPLTPIIVVQTSGGKNPKYRIVDGERRYRAMRSIGTNECLCLTADAMDDMDVISTMLETDFKSKLKDDEVATGVQLAIYYGADADDVNGLTGSSFSKSSVKRLGKVLKSAKNAKEFVQLPLYELKNLGEMTDAQAAELYGLAADGYGYGSEYSKRLSKFKTIKYVETNTKQARKTCDRAHIPYTSEQPGKEYDMVYEQRWDFTSLSPYAMSHLDPETVVCYLPPAETCSSTYDFAMKFYEPHDPAIDEAKAAVRALRARITEASDAVRHLVASMDEWVCAHIDVCTAICNTDPNFENVRECLYLTAYNCVALSGLASSRDMFKKADDDGLIRHRMCDLTLFYSWKRLTDSETCSHVGEFVVDRTAEEFIEHAERIRMAEDLATASGWACPDDAIEILNGIHDALAEFAKEAN